MADKKAVGKKMNTKKKFVADGVFQAELNELLTRTLGMEGYAGIEVRATNMSTEIRVRAAQCQDLLHKGTRKVKEIKSLIEKRYNFNDEDNKVELSIKPLPYDKNLPPPPTSRPSSTSCSAASPSVTLPTTSLVPSCAVVVPPVARLWSPERSVDSAPRP